MLRSWWSQEDLDLYTFMRENEVVETGMSPDGEKPTGPVYVDPSYETFDNYEKRCWLSGEGLGVSEEVGRASFILSDEMRDYFNKIGIKTSKKRGDSKTGFFPSLIHPFYLSMIMGISKKKMAEPQTMKESMVDEWASDARSYAKS